MEEKELTFRQLCREGEEMGVEESLHRKLDVIGQLLVDLTNKNEQNN